MMTPPRVRNMHAVIEKLSKDASTKNIEFLLSVAENNKYGLLPNSALKKYLKENSTITGKTENNDWSSELKRAIKKAVTKLPKNRRERFLEDYNRIFTKQKNLTTHERKIINYREKIIAAKPFADSITNSKQSASNALKNLDYFIASSETPIKEKLYVLSKLNYFLSSDYKINEQLKDKKFQAFSEIVNDLVIKSPDADVYESKDCNQKKHGSCAVISNARKALLYEDKKAYIDVVLQELNDKPYLEVYDITRLSEYENDPKKYDRMRAPKIKVDKARINYDAALTAGYRIIDASVLNWMKVAGTVGDGSIQLEDYIAFDSQRNGFMHDSRIVKSLDESYYYDHELLRTLISSRRIIKSYDKSILKAKTDKYINKKDGAFYARKRDIAADSIRNILHNIAPEISGSELTKIVKYSINSFNINTKNCDDVLKLQIKNYFISKLGKAYVNAVEQNVDALLPLIKDYKTNFSKSEVGSKSFASEVPLKEKLFKIGIAQREVMMAMLVFDEYRNSIYTEFNMPDRATQVKNYVKRLKKLIKTKPESSLVVNLKAKTELNNEALLKKIDSIDKELSIELPLAIDNLLGVFKTSYKDILLNTYKSCLEQHRNGDYEYMNSVSARLKLIPDAKKFDKRLCNVIKEITNAKSNDELNNALRPLGVHNQYAIINEAVEKAYEILQQLLEQDRIEEVKKLISGADDLNNSDEILAFLDSKVNEINKYTGCVEQVAKYINMPSEEDIILKTYEEKGEILSNKALKDLRNKFDAIYQAKVNVADQRGKGIFSTVKSDVFKFTNEQKNALKQIEKSLPKFRRQVIRWYDALNRDLKPELEKLYEDLGKRKGLFWVSEEGHSGLYTAEQIRIIEQMTGRPYHIEKDLDKAFEHIKNGLGSGVSSTQVNYNEFSGHAQYVADVMPLKFVDTETDETVIKDAVLHDNTWGHAEKETNWQGKDGLKRTDYGNGCGGPQGFIVVDNSLEGLFVDNYKYDYGICDYDRNTRATEGPDIELSLNPEKYEIFNDIILPGEDFRTNKKIEAIRNCIFDCNNSDKMINALFKSIKENDFKLNTKILDIADEKLEEKIDNYLRKLVSDAGEPVMNMEQFNKLSPDDPLKVIVQKLILRKRFSYLEDDMKLSNIKTSKGIEKYKKDLLNNYKGIFREIFVKRFSENIQNETIGILNENTKEVIKQIEKDSGCKLSSLEKRLSAAFEKVFVMPYNGISAELIYNIVAEAEKTAKKDLEFKKIDSKYLNDLIGTISDTLEDILIPDSVQDIQKQPYGEEVIKFIENKFNPKDDEDLIIKFIDLLNMPAKEFDALIKDLKFEDLDINFDTPENSIKLIQADNWLEQKRFREEVRLHYFDDYIPLTAKTKGLTLISKEKAKFNRLYRTIAVAIGEIGASKYIQEAKEDAFRKYAARPAIPQVVVSHKNEIKKSLGKNLQFISSDLTEINAYNMLKKYLKAVDEVNELLQVQNMPCVKDKLIKLLQDIQTLSERTRNDKTFQKISIAAKLFIEKLKVLPLNAIDVNSYMDVINSEKNITNQGVSIENVEAKENELKKNLRKNLNVFIETNFLPAFQAKARGLLNDWIRTVVKSRDCDEIEESTNYLLEILSEKQVLTEPQELLKYSVKKACEATTEETKECHDNVVDNLKDCLKIVYRKANRAKLEYKLMSAASKGIATKLGDAMKSGRTKLILGDGNTIRYLSPVGMKQVILSLIDPSNNHSTLMLFIEQTGIKKEFVDLIVANEPEKLKYKIDKKAKKISEELVAIEVIKKVNEEFSKAIPNIKIKDLDLFRDCLFGYIDAFNCVECETPYSSELIELYTKTFRDVSEKVKPGKNYLLSEFFNEMYSACLDVVRQSFKDTIDDYNNFGASIQNNAFILSPLKLKPGSEYDTKRNDYVEKVLNELVPYMKKRTEGMLPYITNIFNE